MTAATARQALPNIDLTEPLRGVLASLSRFEPPFEIDRFGASFGLDPVRPSGVLQFAFCYKEIPFQVRTERRNGRPVLQLTGDLGILPFTIENARRRRRLRIVLEAAKHSPGMHWEVTQHHRIRVSGEVILDLPLTPTAVIAGATVLLMAGQPYLELIVSVGGEP